eukprot:g1064.t1
MDRINDACPALLLPSNLFQGTFVCFEQGSSWSGRQMQRILTVCTKGNTRIEARDIKQRDKISFYIPLSALNEIIRCQRGDGPGSCGIRLVAQGSTRGRKRDVSYNIGFLNAIERENFCMLIMLIKPAVNVHSEGEITIRRGVRLFHVTSFQRYSQDSPVTLLVDSERGIFGISGHGHVDDPSTCESLYEWHALTLYAPPSKRKHLQIWRGLKMVLDLRFNSVVQKQHFVGSFVNMRSRNRRYLALKSGTSLHSIPTECKTRDGISSSAATTKIADVHCRHPSGFDGSAHHHLFESESSKVEIKAMQTAKRASTIWQDTHRWYIFTTTLNCGGKKPPAPGSLPFLRWIPPKSYDIYAIALQECKARDDWFHGLLHHINAHGDSKLGNDDYVMISNVSMMTIHLVIFVRRGVIGRGVLPLGTSSRAMGFAHVIGNKGSVLASLVLSETTRVCFVGSHFAARASAKRLKKREKNYVESVAHLQTDMRSELLHSYDHIFWLGDFNYRVNLGKHGTPEEFSRVKTLIKHRQFDVLTANDQLLKAMSSESVFYGFSEGKIDFAPTYRMEPGTTGQVYGNKRFQNPSYCDRILWRSRQGLNDVVTLHSYRPCWEMNRGDHRPVVATFALKNRRLHAISESVTHRRLETGAVHIMDLQLRMARDIIPGGHNALCRVTFSGEVLRETVGTAAMVTRSDANLSFPIHAHWSEHDIPLLSTWTVDAAFLAREHVHVRIEYQESGTMGLTTHWKMVGEGELWLGPIVNRFPIGSEAKYDLPLVKGGQQVGALGMRVWYVQMAERSEKHSAPILRRHSEISAAGRRRSQKMDSPTFSDPTDLRRSRSNTESRDLSLERMKPLTPMVDSNKDLLATSSDDVVRRQGRFLSAGISGHILADDDVASATSSPLSDFASSKDDRSSHIARRQMKKTLRPSFPSNRSLTESRDSYPLLVPSVKGISPRKYIDDDRIKDVNGEKDEDEDKKSMIVRRIIHTQQRSLKHFLRSMNEHEQTSSSSQPITTTSSSPFFVDEDKTKDETSRARVETVGPSPYIDFEFEDSADVAEKERRASMVKSILKRALDSPRAAESHPNAAPSSKASPFDASVVSTKPSSPKPEAPTMRVRSDVRPSSLAALASNVLQAAAAGSRSRRSGRRSEKLQKLKMSPSLKESNDPVDRMLLKVHRRKDPVNWATFSIEQLGGTAVRRSRRRKGGRLRMTHRVEIDKCGEGPANLDTLVDRLCALRLGFGIARVVVRGSSKYVLLSYASAAVNGREIFQMKTLKKIFKERFGAFHFDAHGRDRSDFDTKRIRKRL